MNTGIKLVSYTQTAIVIEVSGVQITIGSAPAIEGFDPVLSVELGHVGDRFIRAMRIFKLDEFVETIGMIPDSARHEYLRFVQLGDLLKRGD